MTINKKNILKAAVFFVFAFFAWLYISGNTSFLDNIKNKTGEFVVEEFKRENISSNPLLGPKEEKASMLTRQGIVDWTNRWREDLLLPHLATSERLNTSAQLKAEDMAERDYFAHETPTGENVDDFAEEAGYEYILIGENLALGNFKDNKALVQAWMNSPGHRENIVHDGYTEIGIGLTRGVYEGSEVWFAVQHFGKPKSACPGPDKVLLSSIENNKEQLDIWEKELREKEEELNNTPKNNPSYNRKAKEYNELADKYNTLVKETKSLVEKYNKQVQKFNACAKS
ncbi:MAG: CAP domain-containing protein [Candidatus Spechtbacterales bacterium]|nr:CAP domain-containing protein [Candidatus Spechtbacterales bacterium]